MRWPSHKDHARKALAKLAGPHLPATLKQLEKAVAKAHAEHDTRTRAGTAPKRAAADAVVEGSGSVESERAEPEFDGEELSDGEFGDDELGDDELVPARTTAAPTRTTSSPAIAARSATSPGCSPLTEPCTPTPTAGCKPIV